MCREDMRGLSLQFLNIRYKDRIRNFYENPTLFEILEYGNQEIVHTKFLYWMLRPAYHKFSYKNKYVGKRK